MVPTCGAATLWQPAAFAEVPQPPTAALVFTADMSWPGRVATPAGAVSVRRSDQRDVVGVAGGALGVRGRRAGVHRVADVARARCRRARTGCRPPPAGPRRRPPSRRRAPGAAPARSWLVKYRLPHVASKGSGVGSVSVRSRDTLSVFARLCHPAQTPRGRRSSCVHLAAAIPRQELRPIFGAPGPPQGAGPARRGDA